MIAGCRAVALLTLMVAAPATATPDQELQRAWSDYHSFANDGVARAHAGAVAYIRNYGPRFSAAFLAAATQCLTHAHNSANRAAFQQLRRDYVVGGSEALTVAEWMTSSCASPLQASSGGQALSSNPATFAAEPSNHEPPPRNPRPAPPR